MEFNRAKFIEILDYIKKCKKNVKIVAVSKNHPQNSIINAIHCGVKIFGENRVQEALEKFAFIKKTKPKIELHLTGPLQTNKVKSALSIFDVIQTLDREKLAKEFIKYPNLIKNKIFFIQVNVGEEQNKSGILPKEAKSFLEFCQIDLKIKISGLMCIPPLYEKPEPYFSLLRKIALENNIEHLSMGMSDDYKKAIQSDASYIRVGTILFGSRL